MKTQEFAKSLIRANGLQIATRIAERSKRGSSPENESVLPRGVVFFPDTKRSKANPMKERARTHAFWTEVVGLLSKVK